MKTKNLITAVFLLFAVFIVGCDNPNPPITHIHAKVENAEKFGNIVEVRLIIALPPAESGLPNRHIEIARGDWKDCGFAIELPKTVNPNHLSRLTPDGRWRVRLNRYIYSEELSAATTISNRNARTVSGELGGFDKNGDLVAFFSFGNMIDEDNYTRAVFTYVDSDVTVLGNSVRGHEISAYDEISYLKVLGTYSIEWKRGWNLSSLAKSRTVTDSTLNIYSTMVKSCSCTEIVR